MQKYCPTCRATVDALWAYNGSICAECARPIPAGAAPEPTPTCTVKHGAQITFRQEGGVLPGTSYWVGKLLNEKARDRQHYDAQVDAHTFRCVIRERVVDRAAAEASTGAFPNGVVYDLTTQAGGAGGRRYSTYADLDAAQRAAIKWAARRFYILCAE